jgi:cysteine desulfurase/selenocysteine lyase
MPFCDVQLDFPQLQTKTHGHPLIYFDNGATTLKPQSVIDGMSTFYSQSYATVHRGVYELSQNATQKYAQARKAIQDFINAEHVEEIIFTSGTTFSLNLVAMSATKAFMKRGETILLTEIEHHSNLVPWQMAAKENDLKLKFIPVNERGEIILEEVERLFSEGGVKLISLPHISNAIGTLHPIKKIIAIAHAFGAKVCVDGAQAAAHMKIDVQDLDADFYAFSGHKCYGPTGVGILYGKKDLLEQMDPIFGGGDMIERVTLEKTTYAQLPLKFEAGTPMIAEVIGLHAAINYILSIGFDVICRHEEELTQYAIEKLRKIPELKIIGESKHRGAIISFVMKGVHPLDIATLLDCKGIAVRTGHHCSEPAMNRFKVSSTTRLSFGLYNTKDEIDVFIKAFIGILHLLR